MCGIIGYGGPKPTAGVLLEGALKLKEISYIHAEGYSAAELKHGPIALIGEETPCLFLGPADVVGVPRVHETFYPFLMVVPPRLLAYYAAVEPGRDVDQPRNLAESVTVE
jgi:glucosamine--fructose-6-phosphate aminotransferase (isomerizing)